MDQITERLHLIPMTRRDLELFHGTNIDEFVREYLWDNEIVSIDTSRDILIEVERTFSEEAWGLWKLVTKKNGVYIGYVGLWKFFDERQPQLLYALLKPFSGYGYAAEASVKVIKYAFESLNYDFLTASMDGANLKSVEVCRRLGFSFEKEQTIDGAITCFYRITPKQLLAS